MPKKKTDHEIQENAAPEEASAALPDQTDLLTPEEVNEQEPLLLDEADDEMLATAPEQESLLIDEAEEAPTAAEEICEPMPSPDFQAVLEEPRKETSAKRRRKV